MSIKNLLYHLLFFLLTLSPFSSDSQNLIFNCTVKQVMLVGDDGLLIDKPDGDAGVAYIGSQFTVDRETGIILGKDISTKYAKSISIIDEGSRYKAFKISGVIMNMQPTIFFLDIHVWQRTLKNPEFSFSGYFKYGHISGICK
jgi:hypothetical protein